MIVLLAVVLLVAAGSPAPAPAPEPQAAASPITLTRATIQTHRQAIVSEAMDLDPRETEVFWPLYREYRLAMSKVDDRLAALLARYLGSYPDLSPALAGQILDESLSLEEARTQLRRQYVSRLRRVLPDRQVARFVQVERRLDAVVNAELAERVPLVE